MRITKSRSTLTLQASLLDFLFDRVTPAARWVRFERGMARVILRPRPLAKVDRRIPFREILKIHHRISAPLIRTETGAGEFGYYRSGSDISEIFLELKDFSAVPVYDRAFDQGGNSKGIREAILDVQRVADEIAAITEKPLVIDFKEVECTFDIADRRILFSGELLPAGIWGTSLRFDQIERLEVVETARGFFSFTVHPRWGKPVTTLKGHDRTNFLSDTVTMIAHRANLFCVHTGRRDGAGEPPAIPNIPIRPRMFGKPPVLR